jgi:hypothetical protein
MRAMTRLLTALACLLSAACIDVSGLEFSRVDSGGAGGTAGSGGSSGGGGSGGVGGYTQMVLGDAPIAYWPLEVREGGGATTPDIAGDHDASLETGMSPGEHILDFDAVGKVGGAARLTNGAKLTIQQCGTAFSFTGTASYTLEAWVQSTAPHLSQFTSCLRATQTEAVGYRAFFESENFKHKRVYSAHQDSIAVVALDEMIHIVVTYDGATGFGQIYFNAEAQEMSPFEFTQSWEDPIDTTFNVAGAGQNGNLTIDEIAVYDHALSPERVAAHFACATSAECD